MEEVLERFRTIEFHDDFDMIVAIANGGIVPAGIINQRLQKEVHLLRINLRDEYQHPKYDAPQLLAPVDFDFKDKSILLVDDRIKTGSTIRLACELLKEARLIKTFAVNGTADYALFDETSSYMIIIMCIRYLFNAEARVIYLSISEASIELKYFSLIVVYALTASPYCFRLS